MVSIERLVGVFRGEDPSLGSRPRKETEHRLGLGPGLRPSLEMDGVRKREECRGDNTVGSTGDEGVIHSWTYRCWLDNKVAKTDLTLTWDLLRLN